MPLVSFDSVSGSQHLRWRPSPSVSTRIRRVLQLALAVCILAAVFALTRIPGTGDRQVLPDESTQFSLDHTVIGSAPIDPVYVVEQRARPGYRIFSFDPKTGSDTTIFTVPDGAIIYGISLSPDKETMAVSYTPDFEADGGGLWLLDMKTLELTETSAAKPGVFLTEPEFAADGRSVFVTHVDRTEDDEQLAIAEVELDDGTTTIVTNEGITPAVANEKLYYLEVDTESARRSIGVRDRDGNTSSIDVDDGNRDLDHLVATSERHPIHVAVLESDSEPSISFGAPADAHGNHNVRSTWWTLSSSIDAASATNIDPIIIYDATTTTDGTVVYATLEGLAVADGERLDLIASRAIRFVTS